MLQPLHRKALAPQKRCENVDDVLLRLLLRFQEDVLILAGDVANTMEADAGYVRPLWVDPKEQVASGCR